MIVNTNTLFHFTDKFEDIISILENGFWYKYLLEDFKELYEQPKRGTPVLQRMAIPMVCFCDIPLIQTEEHTKKHGEYGIGLSKEWGIKKMLNPVFYYIQKSTTSNLLRQGLSDLYKGINEARDDGKFIDILAIFARFVESVAKNYDFYNEKEWRSVLESDYETPSEKGFNEMRDEEKFAKNYPLTFQPDDIRYIIVKDQQDTIILLKQISTIKKISGLEIDDTAREILKKKIVDIKRIRKDY